MLALTECRNEVTNRKAIVHGFRATLFQSLPCSSVRCLHRYFPSRNELKGVLQKSGTLRYIREYNIRLS